MKCIPPRSDPVCFCPQTTNQKRSISSHNFTCCLHEKTKTTTKKKKPNTNRFSAEMETRTSKHTASGSSRYAFASVRASYCFFKGLRLMAVTVAAKIDKNSLIPNKRAAETRRRVCNGILQHAAVPTGAPVQPNLTAYPHSPHFPRWWRSRVHANCLLSLWDIQRVWLAEAGSIFWDGGWGSRVWLSDDCKILLSVGFHNGA